MKHDQCCVCDRSWDTTNATNISSAPNTRHVSVLPLGGIPNMYHSLDSSASFLRCWEQDSERQGSGCSSAIFETLMGEKSMIYIRIYIIRIIMIVIMIIITIERQTSMENKHFILDLETFNLNPNETSSSDIRAKYLVRGPQWEIEKSCRFYIRQFVSQQTGFVQKKQVDFASTWNKHTDS